jgi:uncharacterized protein
MQMNVQNELRQAIGSITALTLDEPTIRLDAVELKGLVGSLTLLRTDRGLLVSLEARASTRDTCARCLIDTDSRVDIHFDEEFIPVVDVHTGTRIHKDEAGDSYRIGPDLVLDLREALRDYLLMTGPSKPLCKPECAGLCPTCGANLNHRSCRCVQTGDERWSLLSGMLATNSKGK